MNFSPQWHDCKHSQRSSHEWWWPWQKGWFTAPLMKIQNNTCEMNVYALKVFVQSCIFASALFDFKSFDLLKTDLSFDFGREISIFPAENKHVVFQSSTSPSIVDKSLAGISLPISEDSATVYYQPVVLYWCLCRPRYSPGRLRTRKILYWPRSSLHHCLIRSCLNLSALSTPPVHQANSMTLIRALPQSSATPALTLHWPNPALSSAATSSAH